jgi:hypothetical protein
MHPPSPHTHTHTHTYIHTQYHQPTERNENLHFQRVMWVYMQSRTWTVCFWSKHFPLVVSLWNHMFSVWFVLVIVVPPKCLNYDLLSVSMLTINMRNKSVFCTGTVTLCLITLHFRHCIHTCVLYSGCSIVPHHTPPQALHTHLCSVQGL